MSRKGAKHVTAQGRTFQAQVFRWKEVGVVKEERGQGTWHVEKVRMSKMKRQELE